MDYTLINHASNYINKMANGINPLTGEKVKEDDLINNIRISRCLFYVNKVLDEIVNNKEMYQSNNFIITKEDLKNFQFTTIGISASDLCEKINTINSTSYSKKLRAKDIIGWLVNIELLKTINIDGKNRKIPTEEGKDIGLYLEHRITRTNIEYDIVLYSSCAQKFIIDNIDNLISYINK